jgi:hypothetical protein
MSTAMQDSAHRTNNIGEFLRVALANGPVSVQGLQAKARAAELLRQDQPISQCKSFRTIADKLGVKRFQAGRRWFWTLHPANQMPARAAQVPGPAEADVTAAASEPGSAAEAPDSTAAAAPGASSETIADPDFQHMTKEEFIKFSIQNCRALAREACAEAKVRVARYLETGDLADLHPERNPPAEQRAIASGAVRVMKPPVT